MKSLDLPLHAQEHIRYEYSNMLKFSDGSIFRHHLDAERRGDQRSAESWLAMLSDGKRTRVRQLKKHDRGRLLKALLPLLPFAALWDDYDLGPLNRELPLRCLEVCTQKKDPETFAKIYVRSNTPTCTPFTKSGVTSWAQR